jgi:alpha-methylacyl-CoA racemase
MSEKPLTGLKIVEIASIGPGPFAAMMFADHGADVIRVDRPGGAKTGVSHRTKDPLLRGRRLVELNLKQPENVEKVLQLVERADALIEGYRPGVMERLGLGPNICMARNRALVYGRMTGWGQDGPLAHAAGHDINYIALTGALDAVGTKTSGPVPALNLIGDFGGGGMLLSFGVIAAVLKAKLSGKGSVVDAAMIDGAALLMCMPFGLKAAGHWSGGREQNLLDGGAPFYGTYETSDGKWVAIGSIEPPFWQQLCQLLGLEGDILQQRMNPATWDEIKTMIAAKIATKTRSEWVEVFDATDACFAPVLSMDEVSDHPHSMVRQIFQNVDGILQPAPAPRFDGETPKAAEVDITPVDIGDVLDDWSS